MNKTFPPEFSALMAQYRDTAAGLGRDHPLAERLWLLVITTAPDWFQDEMHQMAKDMGLLPEVSGYTDDGTAHYTLEDMAKKMGMTLDEAEQHMRELEVTARSAGVAVNFRQVDPGTLHRVQ